MRLIAYKKLIVVTFLLISSYNSITPFSLQNRIINPLLQGSYTCISLPFYYLKILKPGSPVYRFYNGILLQCFTKLCPEKLKCEIVKRIILWTLSDNTFHSKISIWIMSFLNHLNNLRFTNNLYDTVNYYQKLSTIFTPKEKLKIISNAILNNTISQNNSDWVETFLEDIVQIPDEYEVSTTFHNALLLEGYKHPHILKLCASKLSQPSRLKIIEDINIISSNKTFSQNDLAWIETFLEDIKSIEEVVHSSPFTYNFRYILSELDPLLLKLCSPKISQKNRLRIIASRIRNNTISQNSSDWIETFLEDIDSIEEVEGDDEEAWDQRFFRRDAFKRRFFRKALIKDNNKNPFLLKLCAPKLSQPSRLEIIENIIRSEKTFSQNDITWIETFLEDIDSIEEVGHNFTDTLFKVKWNPYGYHFRNLLTDHGYQHLLLLKLCAPKLSTQSRLEIFRRIILKEKFSQKDLAWIETLLKDINSEDIKYIERFKRDLYKKTNFHYKFVKKLISLERKSLSGFLELYANSLNETTKFRMVYRLICYEEENNYIFAKMATFCLKGYTNYKIILETPKQTKLFLKYGDNPIDLINYAIPSLSLKQHALYSFQKSEEYKLIKNYNDATVLINKKPIDFEAIKSNINHSYIETWNNHWKKSDASFLLLNKEEQQLVLSNISNYS